MNAQKLQAILIEVLGAGIISPENVYIFDCLASSNQTLWELLDDDAPLGTVVIADRQTAGRGQWGRQWQSASGGLYLSWSIPRLKTNHQLPELTIFSAWGIAQILRDYGIPVQLKWPNDLILQGKKLGGILTETRLQGMEISRAIVGVGINWTNPVPDIGINLQSFLADDQDAGKINSLELLAALTLKGLISGYQQWYNDGIEVILPEYQKFLISY